LCHAPTVPVCEEEENAPFHAPTVPVCEEEENTEWMTLKIGVNKTTFTTISYNNLFMIFHHH